MFIELINPSLTQAMSKQPSLADQGQSQRGGKKRVGVSERVREKAAYIFLSAPLWLSYFYTNRAAYRLQVLRGLYLWIKKTPCFCYSKWENIAYVWRRLSSQTPWHTACMGEQVINEARSNIITRLAFLLLVVVPLAVDDSCKHATRSSFLCYSWCSAFGVFLSCWSG